MRFDLGNFFLILKFFTHWLLAIIVDIFLLFISSKLLFFNETIISSLIFSSKLILLIKLIFCILNNGREISLLKS